MDKYFELLDKFCQYDYSAFARDHKSRAHTFKYMWDEMIKLEKPVIVELGTTRSFTGGWDVNCMINDKKYWQPENPSVWDFSAGCGTRIFAEIPNVTLHTVDIVKGHIEIAKEITKKFDVHYHISDSREFLKHFNGQFDLIYEDCGDMNPLEGTAKLQEENAKIIIERELVKIGGFILIDDTKNPVPIVQFGEKSRYGKAKYSIGVYLANGFEIIMNEYQTILIRLG